MVTQRASNFEYFLSQMPDWVYTDYFFEGQSNYAFNLILKSPDKELMSRIEETFSHHQIEYRRGSAGGCNQLRQPYIKNLPKFKNQDPSILAPVTDHIHFYGMYLGNYQSYQRQILINCVRLSGLSNDFVSCCSMRRSRF